MTLPFNESTTIEHIRLNDAVELGGAQASMVREDAPPHWGESISETLIQKLWLYASYDQVSRQLTCPRIVPG